MKEKQGHRVAYAVHKVLEESICGSVECEPPQPAEQQGENPTEFIGLVTLVSLDAGMPCLAGESHLTDRGHDDDFDRPTRIFVPAHLMGQRIPNRVGGGSIWRVQEGANFLRHLPRSFTSGNCDSRESGEPGSDEQDWDGEEGCL
jgi:hypothetical protein